MTNKTLTKFIPSFTNIIQYDLVNLDVSFKYPLHAFFIIKRNPTSSFLLCYNINLSIVVFFSTVAPFSAFLVCS